MKYSSFGIIALITLILAIVEPSSCIPPPLWPLTFRQSIIVQNGPNNYTGGMLYYDSGFNRQRYDIADARLDIFCSSVSGGINTNCITIRKANIMYLWFPKLNSCCKCCTAAQGCGITPRDWLQNFNYVGLTDLNPWGKVHVWNHQKDGAVWEYMATQLGLIPVRSQVGSYTVGFWANTYNTDPIPDNVFDLPNYCSGDCPKSTLCGKISQSSEKIERTSFWTRFTKKENIRAHQV